MTDDQRDAWAAFALGLVAAPPLIALRGWAISMHWSWFVMPLGVAPIGWAQGAGLACLVGLVLAQVPRKRKEDMSRVQDALAHVVGHTLLAVLSVGVGWLLARFMA